MKKISDFVQPEGIFHLSSKEAAGVVDELAGKLAQAAGIPSEKVKKLLAEREQLGCTALGHEVAVPHERAEVAQLVGVMGLSPEGVDFGSPDGKPVRIFVAFLSPKASGLHLKALAAVVRTFADESLREKVVAARDGGEAHALLAAAKDAG